MKTQTIMIILGIAAAGAIAYMVIRSKKKEEDADNKKNDTIGGIADMVPQIVVASNIPGIIIQ